MPDSPPRPAVTPRFPPHIVARPDRLRVTVEPVRREHHSRFVELVRQFQRDLSQQVSRRLPDG